MSLILLDIEKTIKTIERLSLRISDRFPDSSLYQLCLKLKSIAEKSEIQIRKINRPFYIFRISFIILFLITLLFFYTAIQNLHIKDFTIKSVSDLTQSTEATFNAIALIGASFFFLYKLEYYFKTRIILK